MVDWFQHKRDQIETWAMSGDWAEQALKTPVTHAIVWGGATLAGGIVGLVFILWPGIHPIAALAFPLIGWGESHRFYVRREYGPDGDAGVGNWRKMLDSGLDYLVPILVATPLVAGIWWLYLQVG